MDDNTVRIGDSVEIVESKRFQGCTGKVSFIFCDGRVTVQLDRPVGLIRHATVPSCALARVI